MDFEKLNYQRSDKAASRIQSSWKGSHYRKKKEKGEKAVIKIQALQRGRYTRRKYNEIQRVVQENREADERRKIRRNRILRNQQELYLLQSTTPEQFQRVLQLRCQQSARKIQYYWRLKHGIPDKNSNIITNIESSPKEKRKLEIDPNQLKTEDISVLQSEIKRLQPEDIEKDKMKPSNFSLRFALGKEKIKNLSKDRVDAWNKETERIGQRKGKLREHYQRLLVLKGETSNALREYEKLKEKRKDSNLHRLARRNHCRRLIDELKNPIPLKDVLDEFSEGNQEPIINYEQAMKKFQLPPLKNHVQIARNFHEKTLDAFQPKKHWWEVYVSGKKYDIRKAVADWPWKEYRYFTWPPMEKELPNQVNDINDAWKDLYAPSMDDKLASKCWRTFAQDNNDTKDDGLNMNQKEIEMDAMIALALEHLVKNNQVDVGPPYFEEFQRIVNEEGDNLSKEVLHQIQLQQQMIRKNTDFKSLKASSGIGVKNALENAAARCIQSNYRGYRARKFAKQIMAERIVASIGDARRKGLCEECGEVPAVLKCIQCEDSPIFCPVCWVQIHSTRKRKQHKAEPYVYKVPLSECKPSVSPRRHPTKVEDADSLSISNISLPPSIKEPSEKKISSMTDEVSNQEGFKSRLTQEDKHLLQGCMQLDTVMTLDELDSSSRVRGKKLSANHAKNPIPRLQDQHIQAVTRVQAYTRGHQVRKRYPKTNKIKNSSMTKPIEGVTDQHMQAVTRVQAYTRGHLVRKRYPKTNKIKTSSMAKRNVGVTDQHTQAVTRVQAYTRGHLVRKRHARHRKDNSKVSSPATSIEEQQIKAVTRVQAYTRGRLVRKQYPRKKK